MSRTMHTSIPDLDQLISLRHFLHQHPELSGQEEETSKAIAQFMQRYRPDHVLTGLGGAGLAFVFEGLSKNGPTVLFRAELDALPIPETNVLPYTSAKHGISHKCGHDGHMATLAGLASLLHRFPLSSGRVVLLFQPAEETGAGAAAVLQEKQFLDLKPDYVFALHNMPGLPAHQVLVRKHTFAPASVGLQVYLQGKESHAAEPEKGLNPGMAMSELIQELNRLVGDGQHFTALTLLTVVHARLGEVAFGTNPGFATIMATLRAVEQQDFDKLKALATALAKNVALRHGLQHSIAFVEEFPATRNCPEAVSMVEQAALDLGLEVQQAARPVKWSEDFGHMTSAYRGALFGLGAGLTQPQLHHSDYDFPDELIPTGSTLFYRIAQRILNE